MKNKSFNSVVRSFHDNKMLYTMSFFGLSAILSVLGNKFGILYLILAILPNLLLGILFTEERKVNDL